MSKPRLPKGFWQIKTNHRKYLEHLAKHLSFSSPSDWYQLTNSQIRRFGGTKLLNRYPSTPEALQNLFPELQLKLFNFSRVPKHFWKNPSNCRSFMDNLGAKFGISSFSDWHKISYSEFKNSGATGILSEYSDSPWQTLSGVYPEYIWYPWSFSSVPHRFWEEKSNRRSFFDWLGNTLGFHEPSDWYSVSLNSIRVHGGSGVMSYYGDSPYRALKDLFPRFVWVPWKFSVLPKFSWHVEGNMKDLIGYLESRFFIGRPEEWYRISREQLASSGALYPIMASGGLKSVLEKNFPDQSWDEAKFDRRAIKKSRQWFLSQMVKKYLSGMIRILEDDLIFYKGETFELDINIPELNLAFEHQGYHHRHNHYLFGSVNDYLTKDRLKTRRCKLLGITLIEFKYDEMLNEVKVIDSLTAYRPDILARIQKMDIEPLD